MDWINYEDWHWTWEGVGCLLKVWCNVEYNRWYGSFAFLDSDIPLKWIYLKSTTVEEAKKEAVDYVKRFCANLVNTLNGAVLELSGGE